MNKFFIQAGALLGALGVALGAFGAWLLKPYADKYGFSGQNTTPLEEVDKIANLAAKHQLQFCVHYNI